MPAPAVWHHYASQEYYQKARVQDCALKQVPGSVEDELLEEETFNEKWQTIKESFTSTCKEVLGKKTTTSKQYHKE